MVLFLYSSPKLKFSPLYFCTKYLIVPVFAYLIILEAEGNSFLGILINVLVAIAVGYTLLLISQEVKKGNSASAGKLGAISDVHTKSDITSIMKSTDNFLTKFKK